MTSRETTANEGCASAGGVGGLDGCDGDRERIETQRVHGVHGWSKPNGQVAMRRRPTTIRSWLSTGTPQHRRAGDAPPTGDRARFGSEPAALVDLVPMHLRRLPAVRERERSREDDKAAPERPDGCVGQTREPRDPDRQPRVAPEVTTSSQADQDAARQDREPSTQAFNRETASDRQRDSGPSR